MSTDDAKPNTTEPEFRSRSYRHLFSFAKDTSQSTPAQNIHTEQTKPFSFFTEPLDRDSSEHPHDGKVHENEPNHDEILEDDKVETLTRKKRKTSPNTSALNQNSHKYEQQTQDNGITDEIMEGVEHSNEQNLMSSGNPTHLQPQPLADDFDFSHDAILTIANKFCRQETVEQLELAWNSEDGIRDKLRRDFKLKRQTLSKSRRFGNAPV